MQWYLWVTRWGNQGETDGVDRPRQSTQVLNPATLDDYGATP